MNARLMAHVETWRPYTSGYPGLVGMAGAALSSPYPAGWRLLGAWAVPTLGWLAGLYGGDYFDRRLDAVAKPHRPIPSGRIAPRVALGCMVACVLAGGTLALLLNWRTLLLVAAALVAGIAYNTWFKARGALGHAVRGSLTALALVFGAMAGSGGGGPPAWIVVPAVLFWLHDTQTNLVGSLRDADGDRRGGYRTLVVRHGVPVALGCAAVLYALWCAAAVAVPAVMPANEPGWAAYPPVYRALLPVAAALAGGALVVLVRERRALSRRTALRAHEILVIERIVLAGAVLSLGTPARLALAVAAATLAFAYLTQRAMRSRYEFGGTARNTADQDDRAAPASSAGHDHPVRATAAATESAIARAAAALTARQRADGSWQDVLPSAAVSTASSIVALHFADPDRSGALIADGADWLRATQNRDGGWGDAPDAPSTLNVTPFAVGALALIDPVGSAEHIRRGLERIERFGGMAAVSDRRRCKLFVLCQTYLALAGLFPEGRVRRLPVEVVLLPVALRRKVSFVLPFLLAWGVMQGRTRKPSRIRRVLNRSTEPRVSAYLDAIERFQGPNGGFQESPFMASLVCLGLARADVRPDIAARCVDYLRATVRPDGSWPVNRDLELSATTFVTLGLQEAGLGGTGPAVRAVEWIRGCQRAEPFAPTACPPGGWGWSRTGGWPNTDDTADALLVQAGHGLDQRDPRVAQGLRWLLGMRNTRGGWGCFTRNNPVDLDGPCTVMSAHAVAALQRAGARTARDREVARTVRWFARRQRDDGAVPCLWYEGLTAGTACVLDALGGLGLADGATARGCLGWLLSHQRPDGGWGDGAGDRATAEETAWAVLGLLGAGLPAEHPAVRQGIAWLIDRQRDDGTWEPAIVGVYFLDLLYSCDLLATGYALQALGRYRHVRDGADHNSADDSADDGGRERRCPTSTR